MVSGSERTAIEMFPVLHGNRSDTEELVGTNDSINNYSNYNNEITITHWIDSRKFSMMSFKPSEERNVVDIVVTKGECNDGKETLLMREFGSRDIRSRYSIKARVALALIILMLVTMVVVILIAMVFQPWINGNEHSNGITHPSSEEMFSGNVTILPAGNVTYT